VHLSVLLAASPQDYFHDRIAQLTFTFPEDAITSTGAPFWSAPKRFPRPVKFDAADPAHASYVQVGVLLLAAGCRLVVSQACVQLSCVHNSFLCCC
jgi:hypothetical protein